jgi:predicted ester cyclase
MSEKHELVVRMFDTVINDGNVDAAPEFFAENYVDHGPMGDMPGIDAFKQVVVAWREAVPDVHCAIENYFEAGDMAAWNVRCTGTFTGEMMGMPPTGKAFEYVTPNIGRFDADGKAAEHWADQGMFQFLTQVGAIPAPAVG